MILATAALGIACSSATRSDGDNTRFDVLTRDQIMSVPGASNLYEVVQRLRPRWLERRGGDRSFGLTTQIVVYQDQTFLGDIDTLGQIGPELAYEMRWLDGPTASATLPGLGSRHVAGAIVIRTSPPEN
jgi:hypothetical protein